jgi:hypothetical protein
MRVGDTGLQLGRAEVHTTVDHHTGLLAAKVLAADQPVFERLVAEPLDVELSAVDTKLLVQVCMPASQVVHSRGNLQK